MIVSGTYDFSSKRIPSDFVFGGVTFNVKNVYRGEASEQIIAGIDMYDEGWVEEFQNEGGEFLLFLEESEQASFLTPVAGPNGMIQMKNGKVVDPTGKNKAFYETILLGEPKAPSVEESKTLEKKKGSTTLVFVGAIVLVAGFLIYRRLRKR